MNRVVLPKEPYLMLRLPRTQYSSLNQNSTRFRRGDALASTRFLISNGSFLPHATFFSSRQMMKSAGESKHFTQLSSARPQVSSTNITAGPDPFNYTSGRWLRRDTLERNSRSVGFEFNALRRKVIALCPGANSITSYSKKEGGFNRVFLIHTGNAKRIVARLPFPVAGPPRLITNSRIATIQFCRHWTKMIQRERPSDWPPHLL